MVSRSRRRSVVFFCDPRRLRLRQAALPRAAPRCWCSWSSTMAVPTQLGVVPLFIVMAKLGWTGSVWAAIVPVDRHRLRRLLHAPVPRRRRARRADRGRPRRRVQPDPHLPDRRASRPRDPPWRSCGCSPSCRCGPTSSGRSSCCRRTTRPCRSRSTSSRAATSRTTPSCSPARRWHHPAARPVRRHRPAVRRRHHARSRQGMTAHQSAIGRPPRHRHDRSDQLPAGLPLGRGHRVVPDRGRGLRGRPLAVHLGHLRARPRRGRERRHTATSPATTTTGCPKTSR